MTAADLLAELRRLDVHIALDGERLRLNAPTGVLTEEHKRAITDAKAELIAVLREAQQLATQQQQRALVPLEASGTRPPIFAVPGHNGDVFAYRALAQHLGSDQPFFGLQPPGLEGDGAPLTRVEDLACYFVEQIRAIRPTGPITVAGYCAGGTIAFEVARQLANSGASVTNLLLFGAPYCTSYRRIPWTLAWTRYYAGRCLIHARTLHRLPSSERARYLTIRTRKLLPRREAAVTDPVLIRRGAVERATMAAVRAYTPGTTKTHIDLVIPCESWKRSWARPLLWTGLTGSSWVKAGPPDCAGDTMLLPEHAGVFAALVAEVQQRHRQTGNESRN